LPNDYTHRKDFIFGMVLPTCWGCTISTHVEKTFGFNWLFSQGRLGFLGSLRKFRRSYNLQNLLQALLERL